MESSNGKMAVIATRKLKEFGIPCNFVDKDAAETFTSATMDCRPFKDPSYDKFFAEQEAAIQSIAAMKNMAVQTIQGRPRNSVVQYEPRNMEGKFLEDVLMDEGFYSFLTSTKARYTDALEQNEVMDLLEDDFASLTEEEDHPGHKSITVITEYQSFSDLMYSKGKMISAIDWIPGKHGMLAAAYSESKSFDERLQMSGKPSSSYVLIWSFSDPIHPQMILESGSDIFSLRFNPTAPGLVAGGCYNGQVILWDISSAEKHIGKKTSDSMKVLDKDKDQELQNTPTVSCILQSSAAKSHTALVSDLQWLPADLQVEANGRIVRRFSQESSILLSVAADGKVIFWDVNQRKQIITDLEAMDECKAAELASNKYAWIPILQLDLAMKNVHRQIGSLKLILLGETLFFCSSENGEVMKGDFNRVDGSNIIKSSFECHNGPVRTLQRSPFFEDILLSVDIWSFALWKIGLKKPLFISRSAEGYLTSGCWSPSRPGVIYISLIDGNIEVWDLPDHSHQPSMVANIGSCQITCMEFCASLTHLLAVGDIQGFLHIMEIPRGLRRMQHKEKIIMQNFFERQQSWVQDVEERATERAKEIEKRQKEEAAIKEREEQLSKCCWNREMEMEYQKYEQECRVKFDVPLSSDATGSTSHKK